MASLARQVTKEQVIAALEYIIKNDIILKGSTKFDLLYKGVVYPPKEVVRWAAKLANISDWEKMTLNGGDNTNKPLRDMGFIINNKISEDINLSLINKYKSIVFENNENELYKWRLIEKYKGRPDIFAEDFASEITSINYNNLIYHNGIAVRNQIAKEYPEEYRNAFKFLFDEDAPLTNRVINFQSMVSEIYKKMGMTLNHHHDERTISTYLTFKYPEKYTLYKSSFYKKYCNLLSITPENKNQKYRHYLSLIDKFISNYINKDQELLDIKKGFLTEDCYSDTNNLIFAQDILYQVLNSEKDILKDQKSLTSMKELNIPLNQILYGPPGTGKTYQTINKAVAIANPNFDLNLDREILREEYNRLVEVGQIMFTTFHQSMSYEDFVEGIKPIMKEEEGEVNYEIQSGIFKDICKIAENDNEISIIDNFDVSWERLIELVKEKIANEKLLKIGSWEYSLSSKDSLKYSSLNSPSQYTFTITKKNVLDTYQNKLARPSGAFKKDMEDIVKYMKTNFHLSNYNDDIKTVKDQNQFNKNFVLIIDEINRGNVSQIFGELITLIEESKRLSNDESLEVTLPYSKEKFGVPSNLYIIGTMNTADRSVESLDTALRRRFSFEEMMPNLKVLNEKVVGGIELKELLSTINKRVEVLLDRDHTIGHSYFINIKSEDDLRNTFKNNIIPLLQEYFYGDYEKIGMILGQEFFEVAEKYNKETFANFSTQNYPEAGSFSRLKIIDSHFDIIKALKVLLKIEQVIYE